MKKVAVIFLVESAGFKVGQTVEVRSQLANELVLGGFAEYADEKPKKGSSKKGSSEVVETEVPQTEEGK